MMTFSEIDRERAALRDERAARKAGDHAREIEATNHVAALRRESESLLAFVRGESVQ